MSFEEFQDGHQASHLECRNGTNLAVLKLQCLPLSFSLIWLTVQNQMSFQDFQAGHHGNHLGYWNKTNLAILNLHVTPMPHTMFGLNTTYLSIEVVWRFSRWPPWLPSWISERNVLSSSESLCCYNASHQVSAQSDLRFGEDIVWRVSRQPSWILEQNDFSNSNPPKGLKASNQVWAQSNLGLRNRCDFKIFKMAAQGGHLG